MTVQYWEPLFRTSCPKASLAESCRRKAVPQLPSSDQESFHQRCQNTGTHLFASIRQRKSLAGCLFFEQGQQAPDRQFVFFSPGNFIHKNCG